VFQIVVFIKDLRSPLVNANYTRQYDFDLDYLRSPGFERHGLNTEKLGCHHMEKSDECDEHIPAAILAAGHRKELS